MKVKDKVKDQVKGGGGGYQKQRQGNLSGNTAKKRKERKNSLETVIRNTTLFRDLTV